MSDPQRLRALQPLPAGHRLCARKGGAAARSGLAASGVKASFAALGPATAVWHVPQRGAHSKRGGVGAASRQRRSPAAIAGAAPATHYQVHGFAGCSGGDRQSRSASSAARAATARGKATRSAVEPDAVCRGVSEKHCGHPRGSRIAAAAPRGRVPARPWYDRAGGTSQEHSHHRLNCRAREKLEDAREEPDGRLFDCAATRPGRLADRHRSGPWRP